MRSAAQLSYLAVFAFVASVRSDGRPSSGSGSSSQEDTCAVSFDCLARVGGGIATTSISLPATDSELYSSSSREP